jgi:hypothetical protein
MKRKRLLIYDLRFTIFWVCFLFFGISASSQVKVELDSARHLIGDKIKVKISVPAQNGVSVQFPIPDFKANKLVQVDTAKIDTLKKGTETTYIQEYHLSAFDSGKFYFPSLRFIFKKDGDTAPKLFITDSIPIQLSRVAVDTTMPPKPIKDIAAIPYTWQEYMPYVLGGLALIGILCLLFWYLKRRKAKEVGMDAPKVPSMPPFEEAMAALAQLQKDKQWDRGETKEFFISLTDIIRRYIHRRWNVDAFEMTTPEIMKALKPYSISRENRTALRQVLDLADLVKFAKHSSVPEENIRSIEQAKGFVQFTRPADILLNTTVSSNTQRQK